MAGLPSEVLSAPQPQTVFPDGLEVWLGITDFVSPSFYLRKGIELVIGVDPVDWIAGQVAGDWEAVSTAGSATTILGTYMETLGHDLASVRADLDGAWDGNAASNAVHYFDQLSSTVSGLKAQLDDIGQQLQTTAEGIQQTGNTIADLAGMLLDKLIEIGCAALATGALGWTGVGAAIGGAALAYTIYRATSIWAQITDAIGLMNTIAKGVIGLTAGPLAAINVDSDLQLPGAYDNPAV